MIENVIADGVNAIQTCPAVGYQSASVCVPVTVTPFAQAGATTTKCCGAPVVTPGRAVCDGIRSGACVFTISQDICVSVPVEFGAEAAVGEAYVNCGGASAEDICTACDTIPVLSDPAAPSTTIPNPGSILPGV